MFESENSELVQKTLANHGYQMVIAECNESRISAEYIGSEDWVDVQEVGFRDEMRYQLMVPGTDDIYTSFEDMYTELMRIIL